MYLTASSGEATQLTLQMTNDADDEIHFRVPSINGVKINDYTVYHTGNLQGVQGIASQGIQGIQGITGQQGVQGIASQGVQGIQGTGGAGSQGVQGITGPQGIQGTSGGEGGSGMAARTTVAGTTSSLASGSTADLNITGFKGYSLMAITVSAAAWVRLYVNGASRTADASRNQYTDPNPDAGVIVEVITGDSETILISPAVFGYNYETTPTTNIPCKVTYQGEGTSTVTVTLSLVQIEAS
jgi:hypothetical protein